MENDDRPGQATDFIIRRMRIARWIHKPSNTHQQYEIILAIPQQHW